MCPKDKLEIAQTMGYMILESRVMPDYFSAYKQVHHPPLVGPNILEVIYTAGDVMDLARALVLTLCPANGCICDPFMGKEVVGDTTIHKVCSI